VFVATNGNTIFAVEINSETDFAAGDSNFLGFADKVVAKVAETKEADIAAVMAGDLEAAREALVQKIGEKIEVRRIFTLESSVVGHYVHSNGKLAAIVGLEGGNEEVAKEIAMHITALSPVVVNAADMPAELVAKEKEIIKAQPDMAGKPDAIVEKMMGGRIQKFLKESSLTDQPFVKNPDITVGQLAKDAGAVIVSFQRIAVGEGVEVEVVDFAAEVAAQLKG
jgi:elongation factor Ts